MKKSHILLFPVIALLTALVCVGLSSKKEQEVNPALLKERRDIPQFVKILENAEIAKKEIEVPQILKQQKFRKFLKDHTLPLIGSSPELLEQAIVLAKERRSRLAKVAKIDPRLVIEQALTFEEWTALPEEIREHVERPNSFSASFENYSICDVTKEQRGEFLMPDANRMFAGKPVITYGSRSGVVSKDTISGYVVDLGEFAVMSEDPVRLLDKSEIAAAKILFPQSERGIELDPISGELADANLIALVGGKLHGFQTMDAFNRLNDTLKNIEALPGPGYDDYLGVLNNNKSSVSLESFYKAAKSEAKSWTETDKRVLFIRLDFTDRPGAPQTKASLESVLTEVSTEIGEISYDKTRLISTVTEEVFTLANSSDFYEGVDGQDYSAGTRAIRDEARALAEAAGYVIADYDIIGYSFPRLNYWFGGLAGGSNQWLNGSQDAELVTHEFGHNYGLGHSNFWSTADNLSIIGEGESEEYGDIFDIMGSSWDLNGEFSSQGKHRLNWIPDAKIVSETASTEVIRIYRFDHPNALNNDVLAIRLQKADSETLYLSYRYNYGAGSELANGLYVQWDHSTRNGEPGYAPRLLDMTPHSDTRGASYDKRDAPLPLGSTFIDPTGSLYVTPIAIGGSAGNEWIDVRIGDEGNNGPVVDFNSSGDIAREAIQFTSGVNDADGDPLTYSWNFGDGSASSAEENPSHVYQVGGTYSVSLTANDGRGGIETTTKQIVVSDPLQTWQELSASGSNYAATSQFASNGRIFVGYNSSQLISTIDFETFNSNVPFGNAYYYDIEYQGGYFYAVGQQYDFDLSAWVGIVVRSADGINWEEDFKGGSRIDNIFKHGESVGFFNSGSIQTRSLAGEWSPVDLPTAEGTIRAASSIGDTLVLVDNNYDYSFKKGDATWQSVEIAGLSWSPNLYQVNGYLYLADSNDMWRSQDGETWTECNNVDSLSLGNPTRDRSIYFLSGLYFYRAYANVTVDGASVRKDILMVSSGGVTFTALDITDSSQMNGLALHGETLIGVFAESRLLENKAFSSNTLPSIFLPSSLQMDARLPLTLTANIQDADSDALVVYWQVDGHSSQREGNSIDLEFPSAGSYSGKAVVTDGRGGYASTSFTVTVNDYLSEGWTTTDTPTGMTDISVFGDRLVIAGWSAMHLSSDNGATWEATPKPSSFQIRGTYQDGEYFYVVGLAYDFGVGLWLPAIAKTRNFDGWQVLTDKTDPQGGSFYKMTKTEHGALIAVGSDGLVGRSTDGETLEVESLGAYTFHTLEGLPNQVVTCMGSSGAIYKSSDDGQTWAAVSSKPTSTGSILASASGNGRVVNAGVSRGFAYADSSADEWQYGNVSHETSSVEALSYGGNVFMAASRGSNSKIWISEDGITWFEVTVSLDSQNIHGSTYANGRFYFIDNQGKLHISPSIGAGVLGSETIGSETNSGSINYDSDTGRYTISSYGTDIWGNSDSYQYSHQKLTGDGYIIAKIDTIVADLDWSKAGIAVRESVEPGSRGMSVFAREKGDLVYLSHRRFTDGLNNVVKTSGSQKWMRIRRRGDVLAASLSFDGVIWFPYGQPVTISNLADELYFGLAVTSTDSIKLATATFSNVEIKNFSSDLTSADIDSPALAGSYSYDAGTGVHTVSGSGKILWEEHDQYHYAYQFLEGDGVAQVKIDSIDSEINWATVGIMFRENLARNRRNFGLQVRKDNSRVFRVNRETVNIGPTIRRIFDNSARYLRIERAGDTFTASFSPDGTNWTQFGDPVVMPGLSSELLVGLMASSPDATKMTTARFSEFSVTSSGGVASPVPTLASKKLDGELVQSRGIKEPVDSTSTPSQSATQNLSGVSPLVIDEGSVEAAVRYSEDGKYVVISYERPKNYLDLALDYRLMVTSSLDDEWFELEMEDVTVTPINTELERVEYTLPWSDSVRYFKVEEIEDGD